MSFSVHQQCRDFWPYLELTQTIDIFRGARIAVLKKKVMASKTWDVTSSVSILGGCRQRCPDETGLTETRKQGRKKFGRRNNQQNGLVRRQSE